MSFPTHVLMTADTVGGVWTYAVELARGLTARGMRVSVATMGPPPSADQAHQLRSIRGCDLHQSTYQLEWMDQPWSEVDAAGEWLLRLADQVQPDLVHINGFAHGSLNWAIPSVVVAHSCVFSWWRAVHGEDPPQEWREYRCRVREGLEGADVVVPVSRYMAGEVARNYGFQSCAVVSNSSSVDAYAPALKENFILASGRAWDAAKNLAALDKAAATIRWPVYLAGETRGPGGQQIRFENLRELGRLPASELGAWYGRAAIFASPALYEPFGLSVLEAALCGCALVLGDIPSLRELWQDAAVFVPPRNPEALMLALNALVARKEAREDMAAAARKRAMQFDPKTTVSKYVEVYSQARSAYARRQQQRHARRDVLPLAAV